MDEGVKDGQGKHREDASDEQIPQERDPGDILRSR